MLHHQHFYFNAGEKLGFCLVRNNNINIAKACHH